MRPLRVQVRVCEARHLFLGSGGEGAHERNDRLTGVCVVVSLANKHRSTEMCHAHPYVWERIVCFRLDGNEGSVAVAAKAVEQKHDLPDAEAKSKNRLTTNHVQPSDQIQPRQSLNPFAPNFVPPGQADPPAPPQPILPLKSPSLRITSPPPVVRRDPLKRVIHLRVLNDSLVSKDVIGDVALDLGTILESCGEFLGTDRIGYVRKDPVLLTTDIPPPPDKRMNQIGEEGTLPSGEIAVDTWVALRQGAGELRVQILVQSESSDTDLEGISGDEVMSRGRQSVQSRRSPQSNKGTDMPARRSRSPLHFLLFGGIKNDRVSDSGDCVEGGVLLEQQEEKRRKAGPGPRTGTDLGQESNRNSLVRSHVPGVPSRCGPCTPWPAWDEIAKAGKVKVSIPLGQEPLENRLVAIQNKYCYSAVSGYQTGSADEDSNGAPIETASNGDRMTVGTPEWPVCKEAESSVRRGLQYTIWREKRQRQAWLAYLVSSPRLRQALHSPPSFGALQQRYRGVSDRGGVRIGGKKLSGSASQQPEASLFDLVIGGIPSSLMSSRRAQSREEGGAVGGGAFEGGEEEASGLEDMSTTIPGVEVVRLSGLLCCAEYQLQVHCQDSGQSWTVLRRYSDFLELYSNLPPTFAAITPPLPPKSWRSLSHLTMTADFLEDRRVALEVTLRRLAINAVRADWEVQGEVRTFLGFPFRGGTGTVASPGSGVVGHHANVPPHLELVPQGPASVSVIEDLRVAVWMLLSGAAQKVNTTGVHLQYKQIGGVTGEKEWCLLGGSKEDYIRSVAFFPTIDVDVNRTNVRDSVERERVRRVLKAFALQHPDTGYCQAMNFVALFLLRTVGGREDLCFWLLDALSTVVVPEYWHGLSDTTKARTDLAILRDLVGERMPELLEHLDGHGLPLELLVCDWMLSLFCRVLPPIAVLRVWDWLFLDGVDVLMYVALAVLRLAEGDLLGVQGATATFDCLAYAAASIHDADVLIELAVAERDECLRRPEGEPRKGEGTDTNDA